MENNGTVGAEKTVATSPTSNGLSNCRIVYHPVTNKFLLAYDLYYPNRVLARYINSDGEPSGDAFYISKTDLQEYYVNVAVSLSGTACAFWADRANEQGEYDTDNEYIYAQKITEAGPAYENDEFMTPYTGMKRTPAVAVGNANNNFLVMWKRWEGSSYKVYGIFYNLPQATGDINADETIDISDVILCLRQAIGLDPQNPDIADMNNDGSIDISDVILVLRKAIGLD